MTNLLKLLQTLVVLIILGLLVWFIFFRVPAGNKELKEYWEVKDFKTDTVHIDVDYTKLPKPTYKNYTPPQIVVEYKAPKIDNKISVNLNDSLIQVIDSLQNTITNISKAYLQLYPTASKLIYASFTADTLKLDLLNTSGRVQSQVYPVNYARFHYQYQDNQLRAQAYESGARKKSMYGVLYGYAGFGFVETWSPSIGLDYSLYKGKVRLGVSGLVTIHKEAQPVLMGTIGYKLYAH